MAKILMLIILCMPLAGCYYMQAASGQWEVMRNRKPLDEIIDDPDTSPELVARLLLLEEARDFSVEALGLPDNRSYRTYSELERDYVVWNVFAAPEFSLTPKQWCFPVAGCVNYRGYFSKDAATRELERLAEDGLDVAIGGVAAYSTLGKFSDPILSTMMRWDDTDLVALLFHELAHQLVYVKDDSGFNESFATAVEEIGVERWLESRGQGDKIQEYHAARELQQRLMELVQVARESLRVIYESDTAEAEKRVQKRKRFESLADVVAAELQRSGSSTSNWLSGELNNARLISMTLYEGQLPGFRALYLKCERSIHCFYAEAINLAALDVAARDAALSAAKPVRPGSGSYQQ
jgi:predicted aminopeptidase